ncbi:MAG TPA: DNA N-6-adenine-methyltransferase [Bacteroidia bacterium]
MQRKENDNWLTPLSIYEPLNKEFDFDFDPCPYNTGEILIDGLKVEWGSRNFVNPPYSKELKQAFILKAIDEAKKGKICVLLIPVSTSTKLFHDHILPNASEIRFVKGRISFEKLDNNGRRIKQIGNPLDSMIVIFK